ncbi:MAG: CRTAC1 family protein, partial [Calditrichia bacterium]|nr:CRTAC1 family protein [Calditrichia bacterium]
GVSWADYNRDGFLDVFVCGYVKYSKTKSLSKSTQYDVEVPSSINPSSFASERSLLYKNNGNGSFTEIAEIAGVDNSNGRSLSAAWCDFDEDGWPELYIANDVSDNALFHNLGNGTFEDVSHAARVADYRGAMSIAIGDWDKDQDMDMFITHWIAQENALYSNLKSQIKALNDPLINPLKFMDEADRYGLGQIALDYIGFGTFFFDYDNDSNLDLFIVNGSTFQQKAQPTLLVPLTDQVFWNRNHEDGFYDVSSVSGEVLKSEYVGRGAAYADYDNDGDLDVFIVNNQGLAILLKNNCNNKNNYFKCTLRGVESNSLAIGARLSLWAGNDIQIRQVGSQSSYLSQNSYVQHFGLGEINKVDSLEIIWPSGIRQVLSDLPSNQNILIQEGEN